MAAQSDGDERQNDRAPTRPLRVGFLASFASTASQPYQAIGYDDDFQVICVYLCVTAVSPEFRDGASGIVIRKGPAFVRSGKQRIVVRVCTVCRGFVWHKR